jgi:hypothetical protein
MLTSRLNKACYMARVIRHLLSLDPLKVIYHVYFHSVVMYGSILWGTSIHSSNIFKLQKRIVKLLMGAIPRDSYRDFFKTLNILPLVSQYVLSLTLFIVTNKSVFRLHSEIHNFNT